MPPIAVLGWLGAVAVAAAVVDWLAPEVFHAVLAALIAAADTIFNAFYRSVLIPLLILIAAQMPSTWKPALHGMQVYYGYIEIWFPLSLALSLTGTYYLIVTGAWVVHKARELL